MYVHWWYSETRVQGGWVKIDIGELIVAIKVNNEQDKIVDLLDHPRIKNIIDHVVKSHKYNRVDVRDSAIVEITSYVLNDLIYSNDIDINETIDDMHRKVYNKVRKDIRMNYGSKESPYEDFDQFVDDDGELISSIEKYVDLSSAYKILGDREKLVIYLYYEEQLGEADIADKLGVSQQMVSKIKNSALNKMKKYLD